MNFCHHLLTPISNSNPLCCICMYSFINSFGSIFTVIFLIITVHSVILVVCVLQSSKTSDSFLWEIESQLNHYLLLFCFKKKRLHCIPFTETRNAILTCHYRIWVLMKLQSFNGRDNFYKVITLFPSVTKWMNRSLYWKLINIQICTQGTNEA